MLSFFVATLPFLAVSEPNDHVGIDANYKLMCP